MRLFEVEFFLLSLVSGKGNSACLQQGLTRWLGRAWSKRRTSGHSKHRSPCLQTLCRKGLILGIVPFSSFASTEEGLELCDLFHQHLRLKSHCRVLVRTNSSPFSRATQLSWWVSLTRKGRRGKSSWRGCASGREMRVYAMPTWCKIQRWTSSVLECRHWCAVWDSRRGFHSKAFYRKVI